MPQENINQQYSFTTKEMDDYKYYSDSLNINDIYDAYDKEFEENKDLPYDEAQEAQEAHINYYKWVQKRYIDDLTFVKEHNNEQDGKTYMAARALDDGLPLSDEACAYLWSSNKKFNHVSQDYLIANFYNQPSFPFRDRITKDPYTAFFKVDDNGDNETYVQSRQFNVGNKAFDQINKAIDGQQNKMLRRYIKSNYDTKTFTICQPDVENPDETKEDARKAFMIFSKLYHDYFGDFTLFQNTADAFATDKTYTINGERKFKYQHPHDILNFAATLYDKAQDLLYNSNNPIQNTKIGELMGYDVQTVDEFRYRDVPTYINDYKGFKDLMYDALMTTIINTDNNINPIYGPEEYYEGIFGKRSDDGKDNQMIFLGTEGGDRLEKLKPFIDKNGISFGINPVTGRPGLILHASYKENNKIITDKLFIEGFGEDKPAVKSFMNDPKLQGYMSLYNYAANGDKEQKIYIGGDTFTCKTIKNGDGSISCFIRDKNGKYNEISESQMSDLLGLQWGANIIENVENGLSQTIRNDYKKFYNDEFKITKQNNSNINKIVLKDKFKKQEKSKIDGSDLGTNMKNFIKVYNATLENIFGINYMDMFGDELSINRNGTNLFTYKYY